MQGNPRQAILTAYLAGIIDGEGSFRICKDNTETTRQRTNRKTPTYYAQICCGMVTREILELLKQEFNGTVREECVPNARSIWRWTLTGRKNILSTINALEPYLIVKKNHAKVVKDFCINWETPYNRQLGVSKEELQRREDAYQAIRKLNAVGAAATTERVNIREDEATV